ncbi:sigma factor-like helix-turn-helix DNA-binding protein [Salmonella enterica]|nr:sigma factor-like helix-turn-helix DNA-binding protein [Salmonella enterica]MDX9532612.1 sigma factor-like helix-turn-helix DNA-binding protein [Salmonella enterica]
MSLNRWLNEKIKYNSSGDGVSLRSHGSLPCSRTSGPKHKSVLLHSKKLSLKTAFVKPRWSEDEDKRMQVLISSGYTQRDVAKILGRSEESVKSRLSRLRKK